MPVKLNIGDIVELRKSHPCGGNTFEIMRAGMDFRIRCLKCDKQVWLERVNLEKRLKKIIQSKEE
ncbi:hypothetical protein SAMN05661008_01440 [Alkalithermobacter thermoalcaliphilus JW-YL-7 = DSM 7308]|uniref:DUF951 domain-containing protein n=1 Tax=Alkalithermobacter thermoalcaliphilus JW-YL-7 = DSM 7308 TaxID=1121328 RepID=A0A150FT09_CLOPD|nr:protein of unknown function DUF951 [[Clostridium] paradoxum JW-YL-7 = DSM 7308]SHL09129.1 hypothetical protein SAMN05661008_01440 [[Clostridium] paradoxum JW-YL-7 = DSM 7308]